MHGKIVVRKCSGISQRAHVGVYLALQSLRIRNGIGFEYCPACCLFDCRRNIQAQPSCGKTKEVSVHLRITRQGHGAAKRCATIRASGNNVEPFSYQQAGIFYLDVKRRTEFPTESEAPLVKVFPGSSNPVESAQHAGDCTAGDPAQAGPARGQ